MNLILIINCMGISSTKITLGNYSDPYIDCAIEITKLMNEERILLVYNEKAEVQNLISNVHKNNNTLIIHKLKRNVVGSNHIILQDVYIFVIDKISIMYNLINIFNYSEHWNPRAKFVILFYGTENIDSLFDLFWYNSIVNVVMLQKSTKGKIQMFSYYPYINGGCNNISKVKFDYASCKNIISINTVFPEKVPLDLMGCEIKYGASVFKPLVIEPNATEENARVIGFETCLMRTLLEKVNSSGNLVGE